MFAAIDGTLRRSVGPPRVSMLLSAALASVLGAGAFFSFQPAVAAIYLFAEAYATVASVRFWAALGERFDARESKRLFGLIGGFGMAGSILGGALGALGTWVGAVPLVGFAVVSMVVCAEMGRRMMRRAAPPPPASGQHVQPTTESFELRHGIYRAREALQFLRTDRYSLALAGFTGLAAVLTIVSDYLFRISARGIYTEAQLAGLFGIGNLILGVVATFFQVFFAGRFLSRFGIFRYLGMAPVGTLGLGVLSVAWPSLWPAFVIKIVESLGALSINPTGMQLLYGALPDHARVPARAFIDGLVKKGGAALGGVTLLALSPYLSRTGLAWTVVAASTAVVLLLWGLKKLYVQAIDARLTRAKWDEALMLDAEARALLLKQLTEPNPQRALLAAELLAAEHSPYFRPWVKVLLTHPSDRVRTRGVLLAAELGLEELVPPLKQLVETDSRRPRDEAVRALAVLDPKAEQYLKPLMQSPDPGLRAAAIGALLRRELDQGRVGAAASAELDLFIAQASTPAELRELAKLLGGLRGTRWIFQLDRLLDHPDASVRRLAIAAAGECERLDLAPRLLGMLADRGLRRAAREALASMGDRIADLLEHAINDRGAPAGVRYEIPRLLRYLGTARAAHIMLSSNIGDDPLLRYRIGLALSRMRRADAQLPMDRERVEQAAGRRIEAYLYYLPIYRDLQRELGDGAILVRALGDRLDQGIELIFRLLGLIYPWRSMMNVFNRFVDGEGRARAYAVELFENMVDEGLRARVLPILERYHRLAAGEGEPERAPARLLELAVSKDAVLRACAVYTARKVVPNAGLLEIVEEGTVSENVMEKVFLLEGVSIFEKSSVDDLAALAAIADERRYAAGAYIYRENDPGDTLFVIVEGKVRVEKDGKKILEMGAKEAFGEISLLDGAPRPAGARALEDSRVLAIDRQDFLDLVSDRPELLKGIFLILTKQLRVVLELAAAGRLSSRKSEISKVGKPPDESSAA